MVWWVIFSMEVPQQNDTVMCTEIYKHAMYVACGLWTWWSYTRICFLVHQHSKGNFCIENDDSHTLSKVNLIFFLRTHPTSFVALHLQSKTFSNISLQSLLNSQSYFIRSPKKNKTKNKEEKQAPLSKWKLSLFYRFDFIPLETVIGI